MKMKAAINKTYSGPINIEEVELAPPRANEILVKTKFTGWFKAYNATADQNIIERWVCAFD
jgi:Zn-dependent alcohol dehydrogenase